MMLLWRTWRPGWPNGSMPDKQKPGTGEPLHTKEPVTVASFRTWRGWRENVARNRCLTLHISKRLTEQEWTRPFSTIIDHAMAESECAAYKELKDRETRAHATWTSFLYRNEVKPKLSDKAKRKHQ